MLMRDKNVELVLRWCIRVEMLMRDKSVQLVLRWCFGVPIYYTVTVSFPSFIGIAFCTNLPKSSSTRRSGESSYV